MTDLSDDIEQQAIVVTDEGLVSAVDEGISEATPAIINTDEIIDATQNAIIGAAENISEALTSEIKIQELSHHDEVPPYMEAEFWVGAAFVLVVIVIAKPVWRALRDILRKNISNVIESIDNAVKLRDDAQTLLADYEHRCADLDKRVSDIKNQSQKNILTYRQNELTKLQNELYKREKEVVERINRATQQAKNDINASISKSSIELVKKTISKHMSEKDQSAAIDDAIQGLDKFIK